MDKRKQYKKEYRKRNKEKLREYKREYYLKNREKILKEKRDYYNKNKEKIKVYQKQWHQENPEYNKKYHKENREKINEHSRRKYREYQKQWIQAIKKLNSEIKCKICGYNKNFTCIEFHHRNPKKKEQNISLLIKDRKPTSKRIEIFKEEFEKCDILCVLCHRELHHPEDNFLL